MSLFLDGLAFLYMLFNGILGYSRGLVDELGRLIGLVLSIIIAIGQTVNLSKIILDKIHLEPWLATMIAFGGVFSLILIIVWHSSYIISTVNIMHFTRHS